jgi:glycosyltransferase involved in cell wall biosynthesis
MADLMGNYIAGQIVEAKRMISAMLDETNSGSSTEESALGPSKRISRLCVVCDFQGANPVGAMARRVGRGMNCPIFFADTEATSWVYNPIMYSPSRFEQAIKGCVAGVAQSTDTHLHLELGLFGNSLELMRKNVMAIIDNALKLVIFVHSLHINDDTFSKLYKDILIACDKHREKGQCVIWVNNKKDAYIVRNYFSGKVVLTPVLYFNKPLRERLIESGARRRARLESTTRTVGVFGYINGHKDFQTTLRAFSLLPKYFHLKIVGGAHPGERQLHAKNPSIVAMDDLLWSMRDVAIFDRITFLDGLGDWDFFSEMASLDVVILNYLETAMSASSVLSQALELGVPVVASRCTTFELAQDHFGKVYGMFDPGNSLQLRQKILQASGGVRRAACVPSLERLCKDIVQ